MTEKPSVSEDVPAVKDSLDNATIEEVPGAGSKNETKKTLKPKPKGKKKGKKGKKH